MVVELLEKNGYIENLIFFVVVGMYSVFWYYLDMIVWLACKQYFDRGKLLPSRQRRAFAQR